MRSLLTLLCNFLLMVMQLQVVPVKRKDLFKLLGLNDPLDIVAPTEVKLTPDDDDIVDDDD